MSGVTFPAKCGVSLKHTLGFDIQFLYYFRQSLDGFKVFEKQLKFENVGKMCENILENIMQGRPKPVE